MNIRKATINDLASLLEIEQKVVEAERPFNPHITAGQTHYYDLNLLLTNDDCQVLVAEDNDTIIATGYAQIKRSKTSLQHEKHTYLGFMFVEPNFRGKGLNKIITEDLINWSQSKGINAIYLDVYSHNDAAIRAYQKVGFKASLIEMKLVL